MLNFYSDFIVNVYFIICNDYSSVKLCSPIITPSEKR